MPKNITRRGFLIGTAGAVVAAPAVAKAVMERSEPLVEYEEDE